MHHIKPLLTVADVSGQSDESLRQCAACSYRLAVVETLGHKDRNQTPNAHADRNRMRHWARALNLASILEVMMVVALATLHPIPPSELAALVLVASEATTDSNRKIIMII